MQGAELRLVVPTQVVRRVLSVSGLDRLVSVYPSWRRHRQIDLADARLEAATSFGADLTVNNSRDDAVAYVNSVTGGRGADVAIEAVGVPASFQLCTRLVRPGGHGANIGVHSKPATLHLESLWIRDITVTTGLVDAYSTATLMRLVAAHQIEASRFVTHHFKLSEMTEAYDVFQNAASTGAIKVVMTS